MNAMYQTIRITPAHEQMASWNEKTMKGGRAEKLQIILFGVLRLVIISSLIFGALSAGASTPAF